ncbi:MAG: hypothetical protein ABSA41_19485 [Terriglobia bacterium]|jgi:hypothetical protein
MAIRAVEGIPNAMDMDFASVDPDPASLDIASEENGFATDETGSDNQHVADENIVCGQPLAENLAAYS